MMVMKTLRRNISYNLACSILEANHYGVTDTKHIKDWTVLYNKNGVAVARYHEASGRLQVKG
jgi:hypothetical protein